MGSTPTDNPHEAAARLAKLRDLVVALDVVAERGGALDDPQAVLDMARAMTRQQWSDLAAIASHLLERTVYPPSTVVRRMILEHLVEKVRIAEKLRARCHVDDRRPRLTVLDGLVRDTFGK